LHNIIDLVPEKGCYFNFRSRIYIIFSFDLHHEIKIVKAQHQENLRAQRSICCAILTLIMFLRGPKKSSALQNFSNTYTSQLAMEQLVNKDRIKSMKRNKLAAKENSIRSTSTHTYSSYQIWKGNRTDAPFLFRAGRSSYSKQRHCHGCPPSSELPHMRS
jgi:hypothetical protein